MNDFDICYCGDYRHQHKTLTGKCGVCGDSTAPWDGCKRFRFSHPSDHPASNQGDTHE